MSSASRFFRIDSDTGSVVEVNKRSQRLPKATYPFAADALGVHPSQVAEAQADSETRGVSTDFTESGEPIMRSPGHRRRYCEAYGIYDRNGGHGDPQRK